MDTMWRADLSNVGRSKYLALAECLRVAIADGSLVDGEKLPPVRELAYRCDVTPGTVARAYSVLVDEGLLFAEIGRGTFVSKQNMVTAELDDWPEIVNLRSPLLPDIGQSDILRDGLRRIADNADSAALMTYPSRVTDLGARNALYEHLAGAPIGKFNADDIVLTQGGQSGLVAVLQTVLRNDVNGADPVVLVENLAYPGFRRAAELCRARVIGVGSDSEGPIVAEVEAAARDHGAQVFLTSADVNNPSLRHTSAQRRRDIAAVARRFGMHVVDDDCYKLTPVENESYRALLPDLGWYLSSLSKSFTPAIRVGYVIGPRGKTKALARTVAFSYFGLARPMTDLTEHALRDARINGVMARSRAEIADRVRRAVNLLGGHDVIWKEDVPYLWISLPYGWRASQFTRMAQVQGVVLKSSEDFVLRDGRAPHAVRLAINCHIAIGCFEAALGRVRVLLDNPREEMTV